MIDRSTGPATKSKFEINFLPVAITTSNDGAQWFCINAGLQRILKLELIFPAGHALEADNQLMAASATNDLLGEGTANFSSEQIHLQLEKYGAHLQKSYSSDYAGISLFCLPEHLKTLLPVFYEIVRESVFPEDELETYLANRKASLENSLNKVDFVCMNEFRPMLFPKHPYGKTSDLALIEKLNANTIREFYRSSYLNQDPLLFVSGRWNQGEQDLIQRFADRLTTRSNPVRPHINTPIDYVPAKRAINMQGKLQKAIRIGKPTIPANHPDFDQLSLVNTLLGGFFGSRLMKNIREDKGYTYGIGSSLSPYLKSGTCVISTEAGAEVVDLTISEIYKEIKILRTQPVSNEELELVKNYMLGSFLRNMDGPVMQLEKVKSQILLGLDPNHFFKYPNVIAEISSDRILELAQTYLDPDSLSELVVG
jgi:zinc protease